MELTHDFTVPTGRAEAWAAFNDLQSVAECFPGATVTAAEGDSFEGSVKVKLGPIALVYNGAGTFVDKDEAAGRMAINAKGKDKRGNGTAGADVTLTMTESGPAETRISVLTELQITGKPAQFGRSVMQDVSDKLLAQFIDCLEHRLGGAAEPAAGVTTPAGTASGATPAAAAGDEPTAEDRAGADAPPVPPPVAAAGRPAASPPGADEAIDLGTTVLPVLVKTYGRQLAIAAVVVGFLLWWRRRRRGRPDAVR